jgi:two-component system chemotaxis response regulator CheY
MKKLLIVDDSSTMRKIILRVLRQAEIAVETVLEAGNGIEALEQIASSPDVQLVLSDINMPGMNGVDLVRKLREHHDAKKLPIVMITTEGGEMMRSKALELGANGYVSKPFTPEAIRIALEPYLV